jgi:hypothetical protein
MEIFSQIFIRHSKNLLAIGYLGRIMLESFRLSEIENNKELNLLFSEMSELLPDHYKKHEDLYPSRYKVISYIDSQSLISMISEFEDFIQECLVEILIRHPKKITKIKIDIENIVDFNSIEEIIRYSALRLVNEEFYKNPNDYLKTIYDIMSAPKNLLNDLWPYYIETKARRDIGIHNAWKINDIYLYKISMAGITPPDSDYLSIDYKYLLERKDILIKIMKRIIDHCNRKFH